jgi:hypothetical protein
VGQNVLEAVGVHGNRMTEKIPDSVLGALKGSGFPFQTAVAHVVKTMGPPWRLIASEYPWESADGEEFLDLIATNDTLFLTIECKKTRKEILTFLRPLGLGSTGNVLNFRCLRAQRTQVSEPQVEIYCEEWGLHPITHSSEFCIVSTSESGRDQRLLERDAKLLISGTDAYADDFRARATRETNVSQACLFVPVVVTNAPIYTTRYGPHEVSLETGEFSELPKETELVRGVRFRKAFTSRGQLEDMGDRSVFVVNASSFSTFLSDLQAEAKQPDVRMQVRLRKLPR